MNIQESIITDYSLNMKLVDILCKYKPTHPTLSIYIIRKILLDNNITNRGRYSKYKALINTVIPINSKQPRPAPTNPKQPRPTPTNPKQPQPTPTNPKQPQPTPINTNHPQPTPNKPDIDAIIKPRQPKQPKQPIKSIDTEDILKIDEVNKVVHTTNEGINLVCFPKSQELILKAKQMRANRKK
jgi:hypothetical protein